jgi:peroxiredoxin-like protein
LKYTKENEMETDYSFRVNGSWSVRRKGIISAEGVKEPNIPFSSPVEFKGESGHWTPEHFLVAAVVSCFVVTFSAMAEMSKLRFLSLEVPAVGKLGNIDGKLAFSEIVMTPTLTVAENEDHDLGNRLLKKAEQGCLIARSLVCEVKMEAVVRTGEHIVSVSGEVRSAK